MHTAQDLLTRWPALDVAGKRARLQHSFQYSPGPLGNAFEGQRSAGAHAAQRLWRRDPSAWSADTATQKKIANRLGWLDSPALMADSLGRLQSFADAVRRDGFTDIVLLGMGGSSLAPEVLRAILGGEPSRPRLHVLDSTDPAAVRAAATDPLQTLYLISSKSGTTIEPNVLAAHFTARLAEARAPNWASHFVAITDPGTALETRARADRFRDVFINPPDIGGRYSALSFFGLVPAALMGLDINAIVGWGLAMLAAAMDTATDGPDPAVALGIAIGSAARAGRDKLTLLLPHALRPFGLWVEQLIAESTGKQGTGIVPIAGETLAPPAAYGADRLFARLRIRGSFAEEMRDTDVRDLTAANEPVVELELPEPSSLGAEFVRWEIATAVAGALLAINPFDEPNVQQAKDATNRLLAEYRDKGRLPTPHPAATLPGGTALSASGAAAAALGSRAPDALLTLIRPGDYFALLAYIGPDQDLFDDLSALRLAVRDRTHAATMFGYGPRYLHSTGQLHKGGPNTGVFLIVSAAPKQDVAIPGQPFSFGTLEFAQALGDFASLDAAGRRAVHAHLASPDRHLLRALADALLARIG
jgi:glucose-6-phosphate isomerase